MNFYQKIKSPVGEIYILSDSDKIKGVVYATNWKKVSKNYPEIIKRKTKVIEKTISQLKEYFKGKRRKFNIPYDIKGTKFQLEAWNALAKIPYGETRTYKFQAKIVKSPKAVRVVGAANGNNPLCIVLPCHRIIGSDGTLTGYSGGIKIKRFLLNLETHRS